MQLSYRKEQWATYVPLGKEGPLESNSEIYPVGNQTFQCTHVFLLVGICPAFGVDGYLCR